MEEATAHPLEEALAQAARGEVSAFETIVREHQAMVFSIALHSLRDRSLAEDLAQEVFLQLYQNISAIESPPHLRFWLQKVTSHRCIDQGRRRKVELGLDEMPEPTAPATSRDHLLWQRLRRLVASLPEKARIVVILRYQEELELHEISDILGIPINTVKSSLQRSLGFLREKLARCVGEVRL